MVLAQEVAQEFAENKLPENRNYEILFQFLQQSAAIVALILNQSIVGATTGRRDSASSTEF